ncbi:MAG TPA: translation initiation factor IF-2, partial [Planctomycetaceae bacterium]|nr:translation initiation factor IF-2 [Planctomycetaceae bacterium]
IDLPDVDPNRILAELAEHGLTPSQWGGGVEVVETSAITGQGIDELLETLLTVAELHELKANPDRPAIGTCLEAEQEPGRGVIAKLIVKNGTLRIGDVVVCGTTYGRIKAMFDTLQTKRRVKEAGPSQPVNAVGLEAAPEAGELFVVLDDISVARTVAEEREAELRRKELSQITPRISFEDFQRRLAEGQLVDEDQEIVNLNLIIRADVRGSIEAIQKELQKLEHPQVRIKILQASVGGITVGDVTLAEASDAVIIGFNVIPDEAARSLADQKGIEIRRYNVIYKVTDDIKALLEGRLKPEEQQVELGQAIVKQVFHISRVGTVAGCYVVRGTIERGCRIRVFRDGRVVGDYELESLRREKEDVKEVSRGMECGIKLAGFNDVKQDDVLEAYKIVEVARTL